MDKIVAFAEQRLSEAHGGGLGEAIAKVEARPMTSLTESAESRAGQAPVLSIDRNHFDAGSRDESVEIKQAFAPYLDSMTIEVSTRLATDIRIVSGGNLVCRAV